MCARLTEWRRSAKRTELIKYTICSVVQTHERRLSDVLPLKTLEKVKDLTLRLECTEREPQWPDTWNQLTSTTRLELVIRQEPLSEMPALPLPFMMNTLKYLEVTAEYARLHTLGEQELFCLFDIIEAVQAAGQH